MIDSNESQLSESEKSLANKIWQEIERYYKSTVNTNLRTRFKKARKYVAAEVGDDGEKGLVRVNVIKSRLDIIQPTVYAKNPEISVIPDEHLSSNNYEAVSSFAKTLEILLNRLLVKDAKLKKKGKSAVRAALTTTQGWIKLIWQEDWEEDPLIKNRIQDTQDNIAKIKMLIEQAENSECHHESALAELQNQLRALEEKAEVIKAYGFVIDNVLTEDILILDDSINNIDDYANAAKIAHRIYFSEERYKTVFGKDVPKSAKLYSNKTDDKDDKSKNNQKVCAVWEVWDRESQTVFTVTEGAKDWVREPYTPEYIGEQFYPFFPLQFEREDGVLCPKSLVYSLIELQDEYNTNHTQFAEHRQESLPVRVYNKSSIVDEKEVQNIANRRSNDIIGLTGDPNVPIINQIAILDNPPINPAVYSTEHIMMGFELVSGAQDASAGSINQAKTATEAEIMAQGATSRRSEMLDVIEDWLTDIANYSAQILLMVLTKEQVIEVVGDSAAWPEMMPKEQIFKLVNITIRAGSTAKPNKMRERDQWLQLAPQLTDSILQIAQFQQQGMTDIAEALRKILDESLKRFDERFTVDMFLPKQEQAQPVQVQ